MTVTPQATNQFMPVVDLARRFSAPVSDRDKLVKTTQVWVAQTFFGTLLKQVRESPFKSDLFSGGRGGQAFGAMYDQHLAERMSRVAGDKLVRSIVRKIEAKQAYARQSSSSSKERHAPAR
jgi:Rod binding domain-containing protein